MFSLFAATWKRLLVITLIAVLPAAAVYLAVLGGVEAKYVHPALAAPIATVIGDFGTAWWWAATLLVLQAATYGETLTSLGAVRQVRWAGVTKLWAWLLLLDLPAIVIVPWLWLGDGIHALRYLDVAWVEPFGWYLGFAFMLLPMAVLIERAGLARAFRLSHHSWPTAAMIAGWLAAGAVLDWLQDFLPLGKRAEAIVDLLVWSAWEVAAGVVLYTIFLRIRAREEVQEQHALALSE